MKTAFLLILLSTCIAVSAQNKKIKPWVCEKGYWVTESNKAAPKVLTVRFYTNEGLMVYSETINGKRLNTNRRRTKIYLKQALDKVMIAYQKQQVMPAQSLAVL